jgi:hypothetical protein
MEMIKRLKYLFLIKDHGNEENAVSEANTSEIGVSTAKGLKIKKLQRISKLESKEQENTQLFALTENSGARDGNKKNAEAR